MDECVQISEENLGQVSGGVTLRSEKPEFRKDFPDVGDPLCSAVTAENLIGIGRKGECFTPEEMKRPVGKGR